MKQCLITYLTKITIKDFMGRFPWWLRGKESFCQCGRHRFDPWSWKVPHATGRLSWCTTTMSLCSRTWGPQLQRPTCPRAGAPPQEARAIRSPHTTRQSRPRSLQLEKSSKDPAQPKINRNTRLFLKCIKGFMDKYKRVYTYQKPCAVLSCSVLSDSVLWPHGL